MRRVVISRTDNGAVLVVHEAGQRRPAEVRIYDFEAEAGKAAFRDRLRQVLAGADVLPAGARRRIVLEPATNGLVARDERGLATVFTDETALRQWLVKELGL